MNYEDAQFLITRLQETIGMLEGVLPTREERLAEEERRAWDGYYTMAQSALPDDRAISEANRMLEERRKRFGAGNAKDGLVVVPVGIVLVARAAAALVGNYDPEERAAIAQQLRALVSE